MTLKLIRRGLPVFLLSLAGASAPQSVSQSVSPMPAASPAPVHGVYVEARTASVFAGACHYNGERVTEGRSAVMAWDIAGGAYDGVDLTGVKVAAAVGCDDNLAEPTAARESEFVVDAPSAAASAAAVKWAEARLGGKLGATQGVRRGHVTFQQSDETFAVAAAGFIAMNVRAMPDHACCSQPHLVWYEPLMRLDGRRVGYTESAEYDAGRVGDAWQRADENSAFYGAFRDESPRR